MASDESNDAAPSFGPIAAVALPKSAHATTLVPPREAEESLLSWIDRTARNLRVMPDELLVRSLKEPALRTMLLTSGVGAADGDHAVDERALHDLLYTYWSSDGANPPRVYCARCAYLRHVCGRPYIRKATWAIPWATFCKEDGWPLLMEPAQPMAQVVRNQAWPREDRAVLAARRQWRIVPQPATHLQWAPIWPRVAALERRWHEGRAQPLQRVLSDIATMLCANFTAGRDYSVLASVCALPPDRYGARRLGPVVRDPVPVAEVANVHVRRAAFCAAYSLLETALAEKGHQAIDAEPEEVVDSGQRFWRTVVERRRYRGWEWLLAAAREWPVACRSSVEAMFTKMRRREPDPTDASSDNAE
jgi:hypothetical protein